MILIQRNLFEECVDEIRCSLSPQAMIGYNQSSAIPLSKGLYLGYLKLRSSVDQIRVLVPEKTPNVLPYVKIRECQNVSKEEWQWLQSLDVNEVKEPPTTAQSCFQRELAESCKRLLESLGKHYTSNLLLTIISFLLEHTSIPLWEVI